MIDFLISGIEETSLFLRDLTRAEFSTYCHIHNAGYIYQNRYEISQSHIYQQICANVQISKEEES